MTHGNSDDGIRGLLDAAQRRDGEVRARQALTMLQNVCRDAVVSIEEGDYDEAVDGLREFAEHDAGQAGAPSDDNAARGRRVLDAMGRTCRTAIAAIESGDQEAAIACLGAFANSEDPGVQAEGRAPAAPGRGRS